MEIVLVVSFIVLVLAFVGRASRKSTRQRHSGGQRPGETKRPAPPVRPKTASRPAPAPRPEPSCAPSAPRSSRVREPFCTKPWTGRVVWIVDGDTIHVRRRQEVVKIRLNGLDAPELHEYGGGRAKDFMFRLVRGQTLECYPVELDNYGRTVAICYLGGLDIAAEAVKAGVALDCRIYSGGRYASLEAPGAARRLGRRTYTRRF